MAVTGQIKKINFYSSKNPLSLRRRTLLKKFISLIIKTEKKKLSELKFIFCSDEFLLKINQDYLYHDTYTDIITFDLSTKPAGIHGEIYISLDRVKENASIFKTSITDELLRVIFHGTLHLCGYNDKSRVDKDEMRAKENLYLKKYQSYIAREIRST